MLPFSVVFLRSLHFTCGRHTHIQTQDRTEMELRWYCAICGGRQQHLVGPVQESDQLMLRGGLWAAQ
uniref:Putative secreted protein n=1 Tax=Anopheles darlingi TaxID=43151 RepID=A0A2M4DII9_ANODA